MIVGAGRCVPPQRLLCEGRAGRYEESSTSALSSVLQWQGWPTALLQQQVHVKRYLWLVRYMPQSLACCRMKRRNVREPIQPTCATVWERGRRCL